MSKVEYDSKTGNWVHQENGRWIPAWDVRNQRHHQDAIKERANDSGQVTNSDGDEAQVPIGDYTWAEMEYVQDLLEHGGGSDPIGNQPQ